VPAVVSCCIRSNCISYDVTIKWSGQRRLEVPLEQLRLSLTLGEPCWIYSVHKRWISAVQCGDSPSFPSPVGYKVLAALDSAREQVLRVPRQRIRRRYPEGSLVRAYLGLEVGWVNATTLFEYRPALTVSMLGAEKLGLGMAPWCQCDVKRADGSSKEERTGCKTRSAHGTSSVTWNETHVLLPWCVDDRLEFTIYEKHEVQGKASLPSEMFFPGGFHGHIPIIGLENHEAKLHIRVEQLGDATFEPLRTTKVRIQTHQRCTDIDSYCVILRPEGGTDETPPRNPEGSLREAAGCTGLGDRVEAPAPHSQFRTHDPTELCVSPTIIAL